MDENEQWFIDRLKNRSISEADLAGSIETLEMLLSLDALPNLVTLLKDNEVTFDLREKAARAIAKIGSSYVKKDLEPLRHGALPDLVHLVDLAEGKEE